MKMQTSSKLAMALVASLSWGMAGVGAAEKTAAEREVAAHTGEINAGQKTRVLLTGTVTLAPQEDTKTIPVDVGQIKAAGKSYSMRLLSKDTYSALKSLDGKSTTLAGFVVDKTDGSQLFYVEMIHGDAGPGKPTIRRGGL